MTESTHLTHLDADGRARMIDVGHKAETSRVAVASGRFVTTRKVLTLVRADNLPKADVLATARIAGISAAKKTSELIPLCHQVPLSSVKIDFRLGEDTIEIEASAKTRGQTGVEMEALTAVTIAGLTLHDMVKAVDPGATLTDVRLDSKSGGKRGHWTRGDTSEAEQSSAPDAPGRTARVIVASTQGAAGLREDTTGPVIAAWLGELGYDTTAPLVVADADIADALATAVREQPAVIITTGGTGVSRTDETPEATAAVLDRELPGIAEALRRRGAETTPSAALSRGLAGTAGRTVVINLPGSTGGVRDGLAVLADLLDHLVDQVSGSGLHEASAPAANTSAATAPEGSTSTASLPAADRA
ncbi:bifunctional molybdenum cofactor biosynthesis protein MoaC/MoaB [Cryobacterium tagatosivorans]|uniref:Cyclic pyranopterin monophosphate synthase n=2 Tax=Cryobacterium tagatosivorans TaxID=1259199 RepID=A0A4R8UI40_9MICO|nr:bifunctional molybdenum cofactor biosynthesis protein MoaC/MoaB [Cryobacterium tagatosivorans]